MSMCALNVCMMFISLDRDSTSFVVYSLLNEGGGESEGCMGADEVLGVEWRWLDGVSDEMMMGVEGLVSDHSWRVSGSEGSEDRRRPVVGLSLGIFVTVLSCSGSAGSKRYDTTVVPVGGAG